MSKVQVFEIHFEIHIKPKVDALSVELDVYTDGSKDNWTTGAGVFCEELNLNLELLMGKFAIGSICNTRGNTGVIYNKSHH